MNLYGMTLRQLNVVVRNRVTGKVDTKATRAAQQAAREQLARLRSSKCSQRTIKRAYRLRNNHK